MNAIPIIIFAILILTESIAEYIAMIRTGTARWKHQREWTIYVVALPFKGMLGACVIESVMFQSQPSGTMLVVGVLFVVVATIIRVRCHFALDGAFSPYVERPKNQKIIQSGMYAIIRHPMYTATFLLFAGYPLVVGSGWAWLFSVLGIIGILVRINKEEAFLMKEFPQYREYTQFTWRLFPYVY